jgi:ParB family chromosome partitioning protein
MTRPRTPRALPTRNASQRAAAADGRVDPFGTPNSLTTARLRELPVEAIAPNPDQPRKRFDAAALGRLADSILERGVLQPVLVRPLGTQRFELIAGERRWRAAQLAELATIPAYVRSDTDDAAALELALIENAAREDLTPVEEARTLSTLIDDLGLTRAALAKRIGRSRSDLANTLRLLDLPEDVLDLITQGRLSKGHGKCLLTLPDPARRTKLARRAAEQGWSVRQLERTITTTSRTGAATAHPGDRRQALARELTERAAGTIELPVDVRTHRDGFVVRLLAADLASAESILARLAASRHTTA